MTKLLESLIAAGVVALVVGVLAWRTGSDVVLVPAVAFLIVFVALMLRGRASTRLRSYRRRR
jgi:hypothetical protein